MPGLFLICTHLAGYPLSSCPTSIQEAEFTGLFPLVQERQQLHQPGRPRKSQVFFAFLSLFGLCHPTHDENLGLLYRLQLVEIHNLWVGKSAVETKS